MNPTALPAEILPVMPSAMARLMVLSNSWPGATGPALVDPGAEASPPLQLQLIPTPPRLGLAFLAFVLQSAVDAKLPAFLVVTCPPMFAAQAPPAEGQVKVTVQEICAFAGAGACARENSAAMLIAEIDQRSKERISPPESQRLGEREKRLRSSNLTEDEAGDEVQNESKCMTISVLLAVTKVYWSSDDDSANYTSIE